MDADLVGPAGFDHHLQPITHGFALHQADL